MCLFHCPSVRPSAPDKSVVDGKDSVLNKSILCRNTECLLLAYREFPDSSLSMTEMLSVGMPVVPAAVFQTDNGWLYPKFVGEAPFRFRSTAHQNTRTRKHDINKQKELLVLT